MSTCERPMLKHSYTDHNSPVFQILLNKDDTVYWENPFLLFLNSQISC